MKRLSILILSLAFMLGSCDLLDNQQPRQSEPLSDLYNSTEGLENALTGAYNDMQSGDAMGSSIPLFGELMGDNTQWVGSFEQWALISSHEINYTNSQVEAVWNQTYQVINDVNLIIETVDAGNISDPAFSSAADRIKGEALFIRALMHFEAVRKWAKPWNPNGTNSHIGVPVMTSGTQSPENFTDGTRATVADVYSRVKTDLNNAISLLSGYSTGPASRANQWNARALLARVNLQQGNFAEVETLTEAVINSNEYALEGAPQDYFFTPNEEGSAESVFDVVHTTQDNPGVNNSLSTFYAANGRDDINITPGFLTALDAATRPSSENALPSGWEFEDLRKTQLLTGTTGNDSNTLKYEDGINVDDNAPVIRYADVILMHAEAEAETAANFAASGVDEAIASLNEVHLRPIRVRNQNGGSEDPTPFFGYERADFNSVQELLDAIYLERRVELAFEGKRKHDMQRLGINVVSGTSGTSNAPDANEVIWPIPEGECDANPDIQQNPGYQSCS